MGGKGCIWSVVSKHLPLGHCTSISLSARVYGGSTMVPIPSPLPQVSKSLGTHVVGFLVILSPGWYLCFIVSFWGVFDELYDVVD